MKKGLVSIVIPTLNSLSHLKILFPSLVEQTYKNFEVIVNDDKRTIDDTKKYVLQFNKKFPVKYIQQNLVTAHGRKMGTLAGKGEFILHLDADMKLSEKVLEGLLKAVKEDKVDAIRIPEVSYGEGYWTKVKAFERSMYIGDDSIECARFVKVTVDQAIGGHNEKMTFGEDKDFDIKIKNAGFKIGRIKESIYHNEGYLTLWRDLKKKLYYGITANVLFSTHPEYFLLYSNTILRPAFFRNWRKVLNHPVLSMSMFFLKFLESIAGLCGLLYVRLPIPKGDLKKIWR